MPPKKSKTPTHKWQWNVSKFLDFTELAVGGIGNGLSKWIDFDSEKSKQLEKHWKTSQTLVLDNMIFSFDDMVVTWRITLPSGNALMLRDDIQRVEA